MAASDQSTRWLRYATMGSLARQDTTNLCSLSNTRRRFLQIYIHAEDEDAYASSRLHMMRFTLGNPVPPGLSWLSLDALRPANVSELA